MSRLEVLFSWAPVLASVKMCSRDLVLWKYTKDSEQAEFAPTAKRLGTSQEERTGSGVLGNVMLGN